MNNKAKQCWTKNGFYLLRLFAIIAGPRNWRSSSSMSVLQFGDCESSKYLERMITGIFQVANAFENDSKKSQMWDDYI